MTDTEKLTDKLERIHALATALQERLQDSPVEYILAEIIAETAATSWEVAVLFF